ncbi:MAG: hypothetical protein JO177_06175 [Candidatus Eremiobacteraeota bacterium]|nr:hypothetical protein [Candidatus Eremiobacteraeota bacterium]
MRRHTDALTLFACALLTMTPSAGVAADAAPPVNAVNAHARAFGTRKDTAVRIGLHLFTRRWDAQILRIYVDSAGTHQIAGIVLSGIKFHRPLTRARFLDEVDAIVARTFAAAPVEEVDLWCVVPLSVGKGAVVSGDLAQPTERTVFSITVRGEERAHAANAMYWDAQWARDALQQSSKGASRGSR